jgi:hypothetical protein
MRWAITPSKGYSRLFALIPLKTNDGWVWLEPYYVRDCGDYIERWIDPQGHPLTSHNVDGGSQP